ncbi:hypothetical protein Fmac_009699 [Flemingia macrophylla]|uniref:PPM-type phosphatase domain-containing protein n=1 Tax=Flemingia macrophylla TaxID=520843 RepID=A0ABD1N133_9FABA
MGRMKFASGAPTPDCGAPEAGQKLELDFGTFMKVIYFCLSFQMALKSLQMEGTLAHTGCSTGWTMMEDILCIGSYEVINYATSDPYGVLNDLDTIDVDNVENGFLKPRRSAWLALKVPSSSSFPKLDILSSSVHSSLSNLSCSPSNPSNMLEYEPCSSKSMNAPSRSKGFLNTMEVQVAGGAAGEDRVQAVCSEEKGWLFCASTLYDTIINMLCWDLEPESTKVSNCMNISGSFQYSLDDSLILQEHQSPLTFKGINSSLDCFANSTPPSKSEASPESFSHTVLDGLQHVLSQVENDFFTDNRLSGTEKLKAIQLTDSHTVDNEAERARLLADYPDDPNSIWESEGKTKGILRVRDLTSPPYISSDPSLNVHKISDSDQFVIVATKFLIEELVARAADSAGFSMEELMKVPDGRRRKYHDDVTVIAIILGQWYFLGNFDIQSVR